MPYAFETGAAIAAITPHKLTLKHNYQRVLNFLDVHVTDDPSTLPNSIQALYSLDKLYGCTDLDTATRHHYLYIKPDLEPEVQELVLIHELGHVVLGHTEQLYYPLPSDPNETEREWMAQSFTFLVCTQLGLEWTEEAEDHLVNNAVDNETKQKHLELIKHCAKKFFQLIGG